MPVKMTGAQYKAFWDADWGPDAMIEEEVVTVDGAPFDNCDGNVSTIPDVGLVVLTGGTICQDQVNHPQTWINAESFARKWLKAQTTVTLMVDVPRECADRIAEMIGEISCDGKMARVVGGVGAEWVRFACFDPPLEPTPWR